MGGLIAALFLTDTLVFTAFCGKLGPSFNQPEEFINKPIIAIGIFALLPNIAIAHRIFDANGNFLYDEHEVREDGCRTDWSPMTCKSVGVMKSLVRSTPEYREGYHLRLEQAKQAAEDAKAYAAAAAVMRAEDREERMVQAQELSARAQAIQAIKGPVQVNVRQSVSQNVIHY